ncbi:diaminopimelate decarboxylase [Actinocorallia sp. API 0066]|uniref:diaminopimelate decarboxylase n=1 Tax=Actinocorallia sp. API 0066 TaxID=2896846 RepID=UPI0035AC160E
MSDSLEPLIWPRNVTREADGALRVNGVAVGALAAEFGTPVFVLDEDDFRARCREFRAAFDGMDVYYAGKAFLSMAIVRMIVEEGLRLDVCTGGELATALLAGMPAEDIGFHGNNKSVAELQAALDAGVGRIIVDSHDEIARLTRLASAAGLRPKVLVRVTVGIEAHTHEYIATAHEDQKFGFSLAGGDAMRAIAGILSDGALDLVGLHSHIGSQIFEPGGFEVAAKRLVSMCARVRSEQGTVLSELNLGGGFGIAYVASDDPAPTDQLACGMRKIVEQECELAGLPLPRIAVEPGRAIVGPAMFTLYEVGTVKDVGIRTYVSVDGGMSDNIRPALYGAAYTAVLAGRTSTAPGAPTRVVGRHCESGDIVVRDIELPSDTAIGDLLAVPATGAYCRSMASNYNHQPRPPVIAVRDGAARLLVRRETFEDLLRLDED